AGVPCKAKRDGRGAVVSAPAAPSAFPDVEAEVPVPGRFLSPVAQISQLPRGTGVKIMVPVRDRFGLVARNGIFLPVLMGLSTSEARFFRPRANRIARAVRQLARGGRRQ